LGDPVSTEMPGWFSAIWGLVLLALSVLASGLSTTVLIIVRGFSERLKKLGARVDKLEADRSEVAVMAEQIRNLAKTVEGATERMEAHHEANVAAAQAEREETRRWREEVMAPAIKELVNDNILNKERIRQLQSRRRSHDDGD